MRITGLTTRHVPVTRRGAWVFVEVQTDTGLTGTGEASQGGDDARTIAHLTGDLAPAIAGTDPRDVSATLAPLSRLGATRPGATALSAVEMALWDLAAQASGSPLARHLGGARRPSLWLYANINRSTWDRTPDGFAARARDAVAAGFDAVKLAPFDAVSRHLDRAETYAAIDQGIACVHAVRDAVGPTVQVLVDCHNRLTVPWAIRVARELEAARLFWFEDPVDVNDLDGWREVRTATGLTIAGGETFFGLRPFWELIRARAVDVVMPDIKHCGGVAALARIAAVAEAAGVQVAPHNPSGPVALAATAHVAATLLSFTILEHAFGEVPWREGLVEPTERLDGNRYVPSDAPGIGVRIREAGVPA